MFPSVTGMMFPVIICAHVTFAPSIIPCGIKNMFATLCSKPSVTNIVIGQKMARIFPATDVVAIVPHTARHTSQLHNTPLANAALNGKDALAVAIPIAAAVVAGAAAVNAVYANHAMNTEPAKFPTYDNAHDRASADASTAPFNNPLVITKTFPVNNSAPVRITIVNPAGKPIAPFKNELNPGLALASAGDDPPTAVMSIAPNPMSAPAVNDSVSVVTGACALFFSLAAHAASNTAGGGNASPVVERGTHTAPRRAPAAKGLGVTVVFVFVVVVAAAAAAVARGARARTVGDFIITAPFIVVVAIIVVVVV